MASDQRPDLVTVGGLTVDNVIAADGAVALGQAGGNGAYSAVGALLWCERVGLVSHAVATYPGRVIERLEASGIDLAGVVWSDVRLTACNWFIYDSTGRRNDLLQSPPGALAEAGFPADRLAPGQVAAWTTLLRGREAPEEISYSQFRDTRPLRPEQVPPSFLSARGVHLAPSQPPVMRDMIELFAQRGAVITADPGWQLAHYPLDEIAPILARLDAFLPSEVELRALLPGAGSAAGLAALAERCPGAVAVKLGPEGVLVWDRTRNEAIAVPAVPTGTVDPTGAGDAFCGGFLAGLVETSDPVAAARFGALSASRIVARFGADGALPLDKVAARAEFARLSRPQEMAAR